jgi:outer membrane receptor protein involved in Fe transport
MDWMVDFHHNLRFERTGRTVAGWVGLILFFRSIGGFVLWLVSNPSFSRLFNIRAGILMQRDFRSLGNSVITVVTSQPRPLPPTFTGPRGQAIVLSKRWRDSTTANGVDCSSAMFTGSRASTFRGKHTLKAGIEVKRLQLVIHDFANAQAGNLNFNNVTDFLNNKASQLLYSGELPTKQMRKTGYLGYLQDEVKLWPNFTVNLGLRYEMYGVFSEIHKRDSPFDIQTCGGYCPVGSAFVFNDPNNFAPRVSFAWSPKALLGSYCDSLGRGHLLWRRTIGRRLQPGQ